jgi:uncharacterized protein (DUF302 family)
MRGSMTSIENNGIVDVLSNYPVDRTVENLQRILTSKGIPVFALIDHSGEAAKIGVKMLPTKLLIFGSPKAGTPIMLVAPTAALDLPLKVLVWQDRSERVWMSYNSVDFLRSRHEIPAELLQKISVVESIVDEARTR